MNKTRNTSSLGKKMKKLILISGLIFLILLTRSPQMVDARTSGDIPSTPEIPSRITHSLMEQMLVSDKSRSFNVIIATTCEVDTTLINSLEVTAGSIDVVKTFNVLPSFQAVVTYDQIESLAEDRRIRTIEWGDRQGELFLYYAQGHSNTDDLRSPYGYNLDGTNVTVAVVDTGIWTGHDDLDDDQLIAFKDIYGNDTYDDFIYPITGIDNNGHGTAMAGIIAGSGDGDPYLKGLAPGASLVGVRIGNTSNGITFSDSYDALDWVGDNAGTYGIDIVSCSWGFKTETYYDWGYGDDDLMAQLADSLVTNYGLVVVAAAGNYNWLASPSSGKYVICVSGVADPSEGGWSLYDAGGDGPADYSDVSPQWYKPDVLAPSIDIDCTYRWDGDAGYAEISGTSPATAFVSGMIALYLEYDGDLADDGDSDGNPDVKQLLWASATVVTGDSPDYGFDNEYGAGRVDGLAGLDFHTTDISVNKTTAYEIPYYDWSRNNEPMWRLDPSSGEDWYKWDSTLLEDFDITIICDPDLMIEVILYRGTTLVAEDESSSRGDDCSISYRGTATGIYYIVVRAIGSNGAQGYPGDYYDIDVLIVSY